VTTHTDTDEEEETMFRSPVAIGLALLGSALPALAQSTEGGQAGPRSTLDRNVEVALARSAGPALVTEDATVLAWSGDGFEVAEEGDNGVTCYVARSWPESLEPHCFDEEGSRTILPIHLRQMELWHRGVSKAAIDAEIARGLATGAFRVPTRPAMSYMMSSGQRLISDEGHDVGRWEPHLMIYFPYLTESDLGLGALASSDAAVVVDPGTPLSNIMIVVKSFVEVADPTPGSGDGHR
jgi:hypothetical protein